MIRGGRWVVDCEAGWEKKQIRTLDYQWADYIISADQIKTRYSGLLVSCMLMS